MSNSTAMLILAAVAQLIGLAVAIGQLISVGIRFERRFSEQSQRFTHLETLLGDKDSGIVSQVRDHENRLRRLEDIERGIK